MSTTREVVAELRRRLGHNDPLPPRDEPNRARVPDRIYVAEPKTSGMAEMAADHTTALVGIGNVGTRYATDVVLQFQAELAVAHDAVASELPDTWAEENQLLPLRSRVSEHREFLLRPDLGRRLRDDSLELLRSTAARDIDVQVILADGLSASACMNSGPEILAALSRECERRNLRMGTPVCAKFARVWLEDEIGETVNAKVAIIVLGERPGLGTGDGLSAYAVHEPKVGNVDSDRNMISNIHARGTPPHEAATRLAILAQEMIRQGRSGVKLDLSANPELSALAGEAYREPQVRHRLVEVHT